MSTLPASKKGKFVVFYGINNLGKSTQIKRVQAAFNDLRKTVKTMKYPVYDLVPTGPIINGYLREGNPYHLTPREMQIIQALNRTHFEPELEKILSMFDFVISEDYVGTSFAWGMGAGVDKDFLATVNFHLKKPDLAILFEGKRFTDGVEKGHKHETNDDLTEKVRQFHLGLAKDHDWKVINANRPEEVITDEIVQLITSLD